MEDHQRFDSPGLVVQHYIKLKSSGVLRLRVRVGRRVEMFCDRTTGLFTRSPAVHGWEKVREQTGRPFRALHDSASPPEAR